MITEVTSANELHKIDPVFGQVSFDNHEQIVFCHDKAHDEYVDVR